MIPAVGCTPRRMAGALGVALCAIAGPVHAQGGTSGAGDTSVTVAVGAFVDGYYAWDTDRPVEFDRSFTTQPARHAEFNVNLAYIDARITGPRIRGRIALQAGTSVQANASGEPRIGAVSGPSVSQFIQEAIVGYRVSPSLWLDGGIFFSHIGSEGFISRDNPTYTRSLVSDFTPFYESGVKATWSPSSAVTAQFVVVNGWQNVSAENSDPAVGVRVDVAVARSLTLSYDNFIGNVAADTSRASIRVFNEVIVQSTPSADWQLVGTFDVGTQSNVVGAGGTATWYGASVVARRRVTGRVWVVGRVERLADPDQALVRTALPAAFETNSASLGVDVALAPRLLWRVEVRGYDSSHAIWPTHAAGRYAAQDALAVTSLALTM